MIPRVTATVDLDAIRHNLRKVRELAPAAKVMAAIKADAYGHGSVRVARALEGQVDAFAVACLEEALVLRDTHVQSPVALLEGVLSSEELRVSLRHGFQIVVHDFWQLELLEGLGSGVPISVWIKIDTGMHRLGFRPQDVPEVRARLQQRKDWTCCGWMTHMACADEKDHPANAAQLAAFDACLQDIPGARSIANSAALLLWPESHADWVRPGLMLYGASPVPGRTGVQLGLRPAMKLESRLIAIRECAAGEAIGYGGTFRCPQAMRIGVAAVGYADGLHRSLPSGAPVEVRGRLAALVGRVSMDMISIDLASVPDAAVGDAVGLWGSALLPVEDVAQRAGTLAYELSCGLTRRVSFRYLGGED